MRVVRKEPSPVCTQGTEANGFFPSHLSLTSQRWKHLNYIMGAIELELSYQLLGVWKPNFKDSFSPLLLSTWIGNLESSGRIVHKIIANNIETNTAKDIGKWVRNGRTSRNCYLFCSSFQEGVESIPFTLKPWLHCWLALSNKMQQKWECTGVRIRLKRPSASSVGTWNHYGKKPG